MSEIQIFRMKLHTYIKLEQNFYNCVKKKQKKKNKKTKQNNGYRLQVA